jgi:aarF domain-containing kinase
MFPQKLPDELRLNYARLWLAVIKPDMDEVQKISSKLGIDEKYYKLFACILTLRPWKSIVSGITRTKLDEAEVTLILN